MSPIQFQPDFESTNSNIIKVIGVGGGGSNAVNHMFRQGIEGVDFYICNTDAQALLHSIVPNRISIGGQGLGAGSKPELGAQAALDSSNVLEAILNQDTKMVFITAGMGGGTGTGAAPVIAEIAKKAGILTVGIVTIPFEDEGPQRIRQAQEGLEKLRPHVDALLTIRNDRIVEMYGDLTISEAFAEADDILCTAAKGIAEIIFKPGLINVDFMDVKTAMESSGYALMGTGTANGEGRADAAVKAALNSPLLDNTRIYGASHLLVNVTYGTSEPTMSETRKIKSFLQSEAGNQAHLKMGVTHDISLGDNLAVTVIATGFNALQEAPSIAQQQNVVIEPMVQQPIYQESVAQPNPAIQNSLPIETINNNDFLPPTIDQMFKNFGAESYAQPPAGFTPAQPVETHFEHPVNSYEPVYHRNLHQQEQNRVNVLENDLNTPAFLRKNLALHQAPPSNASNVSRYTIGAEDTDSERDFTVRPNRHLHGNVD